MIEKVAEAILADLPLPSDAGPYDVILGYRRALARLTHQIASDLSAAEKHHGRVQLENIRKKYEPSQQN